GVSLPYTNQTILRNLEVVATLGDWPQTGVGGNAVTRSIFYDNLKVIGYVWGIDVANNGQSIVSGGYLNNMHNIMVSTAVSDNRFVLITGPIQFGTLSSAILNNAPQYQIA